MLTSPPDHLPTKVKLFAHRGSSLIWPENTFYAFDQADAVGATGFETDLRLSKDGEIILSHDDNLARFGHGEATVSELTAAEISRIEIASADGKLRDRLIPLKDLLDKYPEKDYIFDCKISDELLFKKLKRLLDDMNFHDRVWFLTWDRQGDEHVRGFFPGYDVFPRFRRSAVWGLFSVAGLGRLLEPPHRILSLPAFYKGLPVFSKNQVLRMKAEGRVFMGYLVNTRREIDHCKRCEVEYVLSDRPDLVTASV